MQYQPFLAPLALLALTACSDVEKDGHDHHHHDHEVISTVVLTFVSKADETDTQAVRWVDGEGQDADADLVSGSVYDLFVEALNELEAEPENITEEIEDEKDEHQLFFTGSAIDNGIVTHEYVDFDEEGLPLGLENEVTAVTAGSGDLTVTMRHLARQDGNKVKREGMAEDVAEGGLSAIAGEGDNDFSIDFSITVQ